MKQDPCLSLQQSPSLPAIDLRCAQGSSACYQLHSHDEFSLGVIDQGHADYQHRRSSLRLQAYDSVTINPADQHRCNPSDGSRWSYRMLFINSHWLGQLQQELCHSSNDYQAFNQAKSSDPQHYQRFNALYQALLQPQQQLCAQSLLLDYLQPFFAPKHSQHNDVPNLERVRQRLLDELANNPSLEQLAQEAQLSRYQLLRQFKQHYGLAPHALLLDERIKRAKLWLKEGKTLADAAQDLGFADQAHFQRHFKKRLAMTPAQYRQHFN